MRLNSPLTRREFVRNSLFVAAAPALVRASSLMMIKPWKESSLWRVLGVIHGLGGTDYYATPMSGLMHSDLMHDARGFPRYMRFSMPVGVGLTPGDYVEFNGVGMRGPMDFWTDLSASRVGSGDLNQLATAKRVRG